MAKRGKQLFNEEGQLAFDAADAEAWYTYWNDLVTAGGCTSAEVQALDAQQIDSNPLTTGNALMALGFSNQLNAYQAVSADPLDITSLPVADPASPSGLFYRPTLAWCVASTLQESELVAGRIRDFCCRLGRAYPLARSAGRLEIRPFRVPAQGRQGRFRPGHARKGRCRADHHG